MAGGDENATCNNGRVGKIEHGRGRQGERMGGQWGVHGWWNVYKRWMVWLGGLVTSAYLPALMALAASVATNCLASTLFWLDCKASSLQRACSISITPHNSSLAEHSPQSTEARSSCPRSSDEYSCDERTDQSRSGG